MSMYPIRTHRAQSLYNRLALTCTSTVLLSYGFLSILLWLFTIAQHKLLPSRSARDIVRQRGLVGGLYSALSQMQVHHQCVAPDLDFKLSLRISRYLIPYVFDTTDTKSCINYQICSDFRCQRSSRLIPRS